MSKSIQISCDGEAKHPKTWNPVLSLITNLLAAAFSLVFEPIVKALPSRPFSSRNHATLIEKLNVFMQICENCKR